MSNFGFVYILTNEYMPDVYKVGCTERSPHARAEELSKHTGVPAPFKVLCYIECDDFQGVERKMHEWLKEHRISQNREFFHEGLDYAVRLLWWFRGRVSFCEPGAAGDLSMLTAEGPLAHLLASNFMQTEDPWCPSQDVTAAAEVLANEKRIADLELDASNPLLTDEQRAEAQAAIAIEKAGAVGGGINA